MKTKINENKRKNKVLIYIIENTETKQIKRKSKSIQLTLDDF